MVLRRGGYAGHISMRSKSRKMGIWGDVRSSSRLSFPSESVTQFSSSSICSSGPSSTIGWSARLLHKSFVVLSKLTLLNRVQAIAAEDRAIPRRLAFCHESKVSTDEMSVELGERACKNRARVGGGNVSVKTG